MSEARLIKAPGSRRQAKILSMLTSTFAELLGVESRNIDASIHFLEMGADSLLLLQASQAVSSKFGVKVPFRMMLEEYSTIDALAAYVDHSLPPDSATPEQLPEPDFGGNGSSPEPPPQLDSLPAPIDELKETRRAEEKHPAPGSSLERILTQQLQIMAQQIEVLQQTQSSKAATTSSGARVAPARPAPSQPPSRPVEKPLSGEVGSSPIAFYEPIKVSASRLSSQQQAHVDALVARLGNRTGRSKQIARDYRPFLVDDRATAGFSLLWKELQYPLVVERAVGSRVWDVDGNEYVDLTMGFGALLFGHSPAFVIEALQQQIKQGIQLGTESILARKSAELICKLTGVERVAFCNSGTEAVMIALRLARLVTGRTKIALFEGCYHGTFDGVLVRPDRSAGRNYHVAPLAPGVPHHMIENVIMVKFDDQGSLEFLKAHAHELAAVLVEPKPSRMPGARPEEFLRELRTLTEQAGATLIFDEVVTGFRFHIGGAQSLFGVQADIVTYGKAIGGGMPVGVVAGKALYLNSIDGGMWNYGDSSYPQAETTFSVGTYFKHPFIMASVWAVLNHLNDNTPHLYEELDRMTRQLTEALNALFKEERVPIRVARFGSLFRFFFGPAIKYPDLFYFNLLDKGVYICETRGCLLSTAHTEADINLVVKAVKETVVEMRAAELLPSASSRASDSVERPDDKPDESAQSVEAAASPAASFRMPLTEAQKDLWLATQMGDDASRAYNEPLIRLIPGPFDLPAMRKAVDQVVGRHEALRTTFGPEGDYQMIHSRIAIDIPVVDFSQVDDGLRKAQVREWLEKEVAQVFDLEKGPLVRGRVAKLGETSHLLVLTIHHLVTDGLSNDTLLGELATLYIAHSLGTPYRLPEPMQFSEYVRLQANAQEEVSELARDENYWLKQLAGPRRSLELPTDRPRPALRTYNGIRKNLTLGSSELEGLKRLAGQSGCTLFMLLQAGFSALMHRLSGQNDLVVGIPSAGQSLAGDKPLVGYCVNFLPLRSQVVHNPTFAEYLASAKRILMDAYEHRNYPLGRLIKELNIPRDPSRPTLISVVFNLDPPGAKSAGPGPKIKTLKNPSRSAKFDLLLEMTETGAELEAEWVANSDLFDARTIERWMGSYERLLQSVVNNPNQRIADIDILTEEEHRLLAEWNDTAVEYAKDECIQELFEQQAAKTPDRVAVVCADQQITYGELNRRGNQVGHYLRRLGAAPEVAVGICMPRSVEMLVAILGILKAGAAYVPLDPGYPAARLKFILEDAEVGLLVTQAAVELQLSPSKTRVILLDQERGQIRRESEANVEGGMEGGNLAYLIYTSGSTGRPKGVAIAHRSAAMFLRWAGEVFGAKPSEVVLASTSICFDLSVFEMFWPLSVGGRVVVTRNVLELAEEGRGEEIELINTVPSAMSELVRSGAVPKSVRVVNLAGEALSKRLVDEIYELGHVCEVNNLYGPSEDTTYSTSGVMRRGEGEGVTIGRPIANSRVYILDERGQGVPVGVSGELYIGGDGLARGYLNRPELTAEKFVPDGLSGEAGARVYRTGDVARYLEDGEIDYQGRLDDQVKIRGYRIEPGEVEAVLAGHPQIREAVVVGRVEEGGDKRLVGYAVTEPDQAAFSVSELRSYLRQRLPEYMVPAVFVVLDHLPLTPNGKVDRRALPDMGSNRPNLDEEVIEPRNEIEQTLSGIWAKVLKLDKLGTHDNFFELGGDSILGIQIISKANQAGLRLTPKQIFQYQTIAELASVAGMAADPQAEQGGKTGPISLTPIHHWFFQQKLPEPHHFNQSNLFEMAQRPDPALMEKAVEHLLAYHDALRLRWVPAETGNTLVIADSDGNVPFSRVDLSSLPDPEQKAAIEARAAELQASLNLIEGPLMRVAFFDLGTAKPSRLLIIIHHLAVDIVSWQILVRTLLTAYHQLSQGKPVRSPVKTTSLKQWAERLREYAQSPELRQELTYWLGEPRHRVERLPVDYARGGNSEASINRVTVSLSAEETTALLHEVPRVSRTQIQEALLTALAQAFERWTGNRSLLVAIEGHGREGIFEDIDLSRTVGWFTAIYPVLLDLEQAHTIGEALKLVKDQLRSIPNGGIGYGLLRYLTEDAEVAEKMRRLADAEVSFNYVGQFDRFLPAVSLLKPAQESSGPFHSPLATRPFLIDVSAVVAGGVLQVEWLYSENVHRRSAIESLAAWYIEALQALIKQCVSGESVSYMPSDFSLAKLDEQKLSKLARLIGKTDRP